MPVPDAVAGPRRRHAQPVGFSLIELLVVMSVIGILIALLLPAVQQSREAARRTQCKSQLRQISLAIHGYHEVFDCFPLGARNHPRSLSLPGGSTALVPGFGLSFWVGLLPYFEQVALYNNIDMTSGGCGDVGVGTNGPKINGANLSVLNCPSSPIPASEKLGPGSIYSVTMPSYMGISGASATSPGFAAFPESRIRVFPVCQGSFIGEMSWGGILLANQVVRMRDATDGTSQIAMIGEASDYVLDSFLAKQRMDAAGSSGGWIRGTDNSGVTTTYKGAVSASRSWNLTTIMHPIGARNSPVTDGCFNFSPNRPLLSAHADGTHIGMADGSVRFASDYLDLTVLKRLCTRDDTAPLGEF